MALISGTSAEEPRRGVFGRVKTKAPKPVVDPVRAPREDMSPAARRALARADAPVQKRTFVHETDAGNAESIRRGGIRPSRGGGSGGNEGVYAYEGGAQGRRVPEGRALIEFQADPNRIGGRGTTPGARSVVLQGGQIDPADITGGYGSSGRLFDLASSGAGLLSLLSTFAPMIPGFEERFPRTSWLAQGGPLGDAFQQTLQQSPISPYNPRWQETTLA